MQALFVEPETSVEAALDEFGEVLDSLHDDDTRVHTICLPESQLHPHSPLLLGIKILVGITTAFTGSANHL